MISPFVRFNFNRENIHSTAVIRKGEIIWIPGVALYNVEFYNRVRLLLSQKDGVVRIFDKEVELFGLDLVFVVLQSHPSSFDFSLQRADNKESVPFARLSVTANGTVTFDDKVINCTKARSLYARSLTLGVLGRNVIY